MKKKITIYSNQFFFSIDYYFSDLTPSWLSSILINYLQKKITGNIQFSFSVNFIFFMFGSAKDWFSLLFGFKETGYSSTQKQFEIEGNTIKSKVNGETFEIGEFSTPSLKELRERVKETVTPGEPNSLKISHIGVRDIYQTHQEPEYEHALFQVASQFNCLEFVSASVIPENGITGYAADHTQGPACSLACPVATLFRNYFATTPKGKKGQTKNDQINNLDELERLVNNEKNKFWVTNNGYTNSSKKALAKFNKKCDDLKWKRDSLLESIKIGLHKNVQVISTFSEEPKKIQKVSQAFCSGISISYSKAGQDDWENVARIVLDACYESTLLAAVLNAKENGSNIVVLTFIGGGVFGNNWEWIFCSIARACALLDCYDLDVRIAHYRRVSDESAQAINQKFEEIKEMLKKE